MYGNYWKPTKETTSEPEPEGTAADPQPSVSTAFPHGQEGVPSPEKGQTGVTMTNPIYLNQFGQWLTDQHGKLVKSLWDEQKQTQESLVREVYCFLRGTAPVPVGAETGQPPTY